MIDHPRARISSEVATSLEIYVGRLVHLLFQKGEQLVDNYRIIRSRGENMCIIVFSYRFFSILLCF